MKTVADTLLEVLEAHPNAQLVIRRQTDSGSTLSLTLREYMVDGPVKTCGQLLSVTELRAGGDIKLGATLERMSRRFYGEPLEDNPKAVAKREKTREIFRRRRT